MTEDKDSPSEIAKRADQEDPIVMYLIVRESLNMSIGKTAAQCAHASQMLHIQFNNLQLEDMAGWCDEVSLARKKIYQEWLDGSFRKVVLKADDKEWRKIGGAFVNEVTRVTVIDAGLTEIASGSETVIGLWPMRKSERPKILTKLQALK